MREYRLSGEVCLFDSAGHPLAVPVYVSARLSGTAGVRYLALRAVPSFPSHEAAIRASLAISGAAPMPHPAPPSTLPLTCAHVLDLRISARAHTYDPGGSALAFGICYNGAARAYELRVGATGPVICAHPDITVIGALLRGERFEPGFLRKVLDPAYEPDTLTLDADDREARRARAAAQGAQTRADARAREEAAAARRRLLPETDAPDDLSIDDLLRDL